MTDNTQKPSGGAMRAGGRIAPNWHGLKNRHALIEECASIIDNVSGAADMAEALDNLLYLAKTESNGAGIWAKYIQQAENALTKYRIPYPSEAE